MLDKGSSYLTKYPVNLIDWDMFHRGYKVGKTIFQVTTYIHVHAK